MKKHSSPYSHLADEELLDKYIQQNDLLFFSELYLRYYHLVFGVCLKYLHDKESAKDAVMDLYEKLSATLKTQQIRNFKGWLHRVAKNHCLMIIRKNKGRYFEQAEGAVQEAKIMEMEAVLHPSGDEKESELQRMEKGLQQLNHEQKLCIELFYLREMSYSQIASETGYSLLQVKSYIQNGKRNLKIILQQHAG